MDKQQILRSAFSKAKKNGWNSNGYEYIVLSFDHTSLPPSVIYTKDFAKAFWGNEYRENEYSSEILYPYVGGFEWEFDGQAWECYLMRMVLEDDPIKYLSAFLQDNPPSGGGAR